MNPSPSLHQLLHSLSQAEKRYLRVYTTRHVKGEQNQYAILLDAIWAQEEYDEALVKHQWEAAGANPKQLASVKNYLFGIVLQAMRDFHRASHPQREIEDLLVDAAFLGSRGMYAEAEKILGKAKEKAIAHELHTLTLQADSVARAHAIWTHEQDVDQRLEDLAQSSRATLQNLDLGTRAQIVYYQTVSMARRHFALRDPDMREKVEALNAHATMQEAQNASDFTPRLHFHRAMALTAQLQGQHDISIHQHHALFSLWEAFPKMQVVHGGIYIVSLANMLAACHNLNRFSEMPPILQKLQAITPNSPSEETEIAHNTLYYTLLHAMNTGGWDTAAQTAKDLEAFLLKKEKAIPKARVIAIRYNVAITYFFLEQFKPALHALNTILHDEQSRHREDIQQAARLMQAVVHYQLGNLDLLDYLLRSVRRYLQNREALHAYEETLIKHLKRLAGNPHEQKDILQTLQQQLQVLRTDPDNAHAPGLQEVQHWVEATLKGCPLRDVVT
jgi:hypothetical protein